MIFEKTEKYLPYSRQDISIGDIKCVLKVLRSQYITQGPVVDEFENALAKKVSSKFAIAHNSATSALHTACLSLGLGSKDILWTSPITFVASANCGMYCGASIDFVDIDFKTGLISYDSLKEKLKLAEKNGKLPKILVVVHLGGASCDMKKISELSKKYGFAIIEDASHALGGEYLNEPVGNCKYSNITVFSFHPVKIITSGEGGVACTNDKSLAEKMRMFVSHGITKDIKRFLLSTTNSWGYEQQYLGFNYRLSDIHAALGLSQLNRLNKIVIERNKLLKNYIKIFSNTNLKFLTIPDNVLSSVHLAILKISNDNELLHKKIFKNLRLKKIGVQLHYNPVHLQPYYRNLGFKEGDYPNSEKYAKSYLSIPLFPGLKKKDQLRVFNKISDELKNKNK